MPVGDGWRVKTAEEPSELDPPVATGGPLPESCTGKVPKWHFFAARESRPLEGPVRGEDPPSKRMMSFNNTSIVVFPPPTCLQSIAVFPPPLRAIRPVRRSYAMGCL